MKQNSSGRCAKSSISLKKDFNSLHISFALIPAWAASRRNDCVNGYQFLLFSELHQLLILEGILIKTKGTYLPIYLCGKLENQTCKKYKK